MAIFSKSAKAESPTPSGEKVDNTSDGEFDTMGTSQIEDVTGPRLVDEETEKRLIRKLDKRIIPMVSRREHVPKAVIKLTFSLRSCGCT